MKTKIISILLSAFLISAISSCTEKRTGTIDVKFNSELTKEDLSRIKTNLASQDIELTYDNLTFNKEGKLKTISASIDFNDGVKGSFVSRELEPNDSTGFYRDFSKD